MDGRDREEAAGKDNDAGGPSSSAKPPVGRGRHSRRRKIAANAVAIIIIVLVFAFAIPLFANYGKIFEVLGNLGIGQMMVLLAVSLATIALAWSMFWVSLPGLGFWQSAQLSLSQNLIASTIPAGVPVSVGMAYAIIDSYGFDADDLALMLGVSGIWNTFARLSLPMVSALVLIVTGHGSTRILALALIGFAAMAVIVAVLALALWKPSAARRMGDLAGRAASWFLRFFHREPVTTWGDALVDFRDQTISVAKERWVVLSILAITYQLVTFAVFLLSIRFIGISAKSISLPEAFMVFAIVRLISAIPITPGALGVSEVSYTAFLVAAGASRPEAAAGVLLFRGLTYLLPLPLGVIAYLSWMIRQNRKSPENESSPQEERVIGSTNISPK